ncbi:transcriptional regulators [Thiohalobacter thiocyanaticus]|uniref:Transcriptional regulators n=1 Tax=Thiohalobacter thiocyanaticus TaxID=585455 RepID=A0A1Z4VRE3_9GAMM|nr:MbcA/ParS/Xre antitoxin family protein [Thiohalobacter thiocyanaticus]BAZ93774.1 transcriptional regulators [Thiohalobacter thiocyanaticus]
MTDSHSQDELIALGRAAEAAGLDLEDLQALREFRDQGGDLLMLMKRMRQELDYEAVRSGRKTAADMSLFSPETAARTRIKHRLEDVDDDPLEVLMRDYRFTLEEVAGLLDVSKSAVEARIRDDEAFGIDSEAVWQLHDIRNLAHRALEVLGETEKAARWLHKPNLALNGETPLSRLATREGIQQIEAVLERISEGLPG